MKSMRVDHKAVFQPSHGGDIQGAGTFYGIAQDRWLDLSTGVNPVSYPIPAMPQTVFSRLPYIQEDLLTAAADYYGCDSLLAVAGSQAAIQLLPTVLTTYPVLLPSSGYKEHEKHWRDAGHSCSFYDALQTDAAAADIDAALLAMPQQHLVIINPNNPTGLCFPREQIIGWARLLADDACLIIDEAFMDVTPEQSILSAAIPESVKHKIIVLKSLGKFFGLAGVRLGFVAAAEPLLTSMSAALGDWGVNGPAQYIGRQALMDVAWQQQNRQEILANYLYTTQVFHDLLGSPFSCFTGMGMNAADKTCVKPSLFVSYRLPASRALWLFDQLAQQGVLTRLVPVTEDTLLLRIGLVNRKDKDQCRHFVAAVSAVKNHCQEKVVPVTAR